MTDGNCYLTCTLTFHHPYFTISREVEIDWHDLENMRALGEDLKDEIQELLYEAEIQETCPSN